MFTISENAPQNPVCRWRRLGRQRTPTRSRNGTVLN